MACSVCCDAYNLSLRGKVKCEFGDCPYEACKSCWRTYFLNTTLEPHCMECKKAFSPKFQVMQFNRSFLESDYKTHRRLLLIDREVSKLPETMPAAERQCEVEAQEAIAAALLEKINELGKQQQMLHQQRSLCYDKIREIKNGIKNVATVEKRRFIMPCPNNDCRGYLSSQYKCELCKLFTCAECHEIIGHSKTDDHTCDPNNVQSAELIKRDTKPCPCCGTRITKISGCDQMWCPECHKAFSWKTGVVDTGVVHNPHFYQHQQQMAAAQGQGQAPLAVARQCVEGVGNGNLCSWYTFNLSVLSKLRDYISVPLDHEYVVANNITSSMELRNILTELHRSLLHMMNVTAPELRTKVREMSNHEEMRVKYILKRCSKEELSAHVYRCDTLRQKSTEMLHIIELFNVVGSETFQRLLTSPLRHDEFVNLTIQQLAELNQLRQYCNKQLAAVSATYNQSVIQLKDNFETHRKKFSIKSQKLAKVLEEEEAK